MTLPPRSTAPTVAGCRLVGCSVISEQPLRSRAVAGVSQHVSVCLGPVLASHDLHLSRLCLFHGIKDINLPCSRKNAGRRRSHPPPVVGRQATPLHRPHRDKRHAHANVNARIRHRRHLWTPTVVLGPRSALIGQQVATLPTATTAAPQAPTRPGSKASTPRLGASLPTHHASVPGSPSSSTQIGVLCRVLHHSRPAPKDDDQDTSAGRLLPHKKSALLLGGQH